MMNACIIGAGMVGQNPARINNELKEVGDTYAFDFNKESLKDIAACVRAKFSLTMDERLRSVDLVSLAVTTRFPFDIVKKSIDSYVHILIGNPLPLIAKEGEALVRYISEGNTVGVGHIRQFNLIVSENHTIVSDPEYIPFHWHTSTFCRIADTSIFDDMMTHDIDILFKSPYPDYDVTINTRGNSNIELINRPFDHYTFYPPMSAKKIRSIDIEKENMKSEGDFRTQVICVHRKPATYDQTSDLYRQENGIEKVRVNKIEPVKVEHQVLNWTAQDGRELAATLEQGPGNPRIFEANQQEVST